MLSRVHRQGITRTLQVLTARSCGFFRPGNTILVPGMYFFGACKAHCDCT